MLSRLSDATLYCTRIRLDKFTGRQACELGQRDLIGQSHGNMQRLTSTVRSDWPAASEDEETNGQTEQLDEVQTLTSRGLHCSENKAKHKKYKANSIKNKKTASPNHEHIGIYIYWVGCSILHN